MTAQTINIYQIDQNLLSKYACLLVSKFYTQSYKTLVLTKDKNDGISIDKLLWTFSQQSFLPHGLIDEEFSDKQPILISWQEDFPSNFDTLLTLDRFQPEYLNHFERIALFTWQEDLINKAKKVMKNGSHYIYNTFTQKWDSN